MYILGEYNVYSWRIQCIFLENTMNNSNNKINTFSEWRNDKYIFEEYDKINIVLRIQYLYLRMW